jgi:hypothetical protein
MAMPPAPERNRKTAWALMWRTLLLVALVFAGLQCRHPFFTMTDDNLVAGYPFFSEIGNHLLRGESPWYSDHIFGGHYNLLRDVQYFAWHPFYLLTSLLAGTPFHLWMLDIDAFFLYLLAAAGFVALASHLRREGLLEATDEWIVFCTLSLTFTMMALTTCASWLTFEASAGALSWLALGILQRQWRWGIGLVTLFSVHQILGGHAEPMISNSIFLSFFALGISLWRRSFRPLVFWFAGYAFAVIIVLPLLIPAIEGFLASGRSHGVPLTDIGDNNIPASLFASSFFLGTALSFIHEPPVGTINGIYIFSLGSSAAAWCLVPALLSRARWRFLEILSLGLMAAAVVLVCRPLFISELLLHLPIFKSMRWPFRELVQLQFFFHLFLLLRPVTWTPRLRFLTALVSSTVFVLPMLFFQVTPTFNAMPLDRSMILSGKFEPYWARVRTFLKPEDRFVVLIPAPANQTDSMKEAYCLMGAYNYPMIAGVVCGSGYSQTSPIEQLYLHIPLCSPWGAYNITQREELLRARPNLKFITLEHVNPFKVTLSSRDGPTIDLTPYIPRNVEVW